MSESQGFFEAFRDRLAESGVAVFDGHQINTAEIPLDYFVLCVETLAQPSRLTALSGDIQVTVTTICASRDPNGTRRLVDDCRARFTDWSANPGRADPLREEESGPLLLDREGRDVRYSATIIHRCIASRNTQETP